MKNRREPKHADGNDLKPKPSPGEAERRPSAGSPRGSAPARADRTTIEGASRDRPPVDLGIEMLRVELQELLSDDPDTPVTDLGEIIRYAYAREEMTHEERIACRMRIHSSKALREAYLEILGRFTTSGRRRTPGCRATRVPPTPTDEGKA